VGRGGLVGVYEQNKSKRCERIWTIPSGLIQSLPTGTLRLRLEHLHLRGEAEVDEVEPRMYAHIRRLSAAEYGKEKIVEVYRNPI